ncbi:MATE efflux family protein [Lindgomyces ingoldianus]|uniref:MATE efflux family protein n=1 Tax=Lindgomyces ingoldianus TaxID=673940 RepID=A0ACB6R420_9PLEO|nr:MATE efflux family protein [Lindgomyces ingoldianus]KAF2473999.1 MATE efflux family protein [Lindgomyces ingoldianus]
MESLSSSPHIAQESIAQDLLEDGCEEEQSSSSSSEDNDSDGSTIRPQYAMIHGRRQSYVNPGARSTSIFSTSLPERGYLSKREKALVREEERSLLRDNHILPPKHPRQRRGSEGLLSSRLGKKLSLSALRKVRSAMDEEAAIDIDEPSEATALLQGDCTLPYGGLDTPKTINRTWDEAVVAGKIHTTWQRETKFLTKTSAPLILTFLLQYSLPVASVFTVGHIGKVELGAVSLASMTASITGYAVYQGLATSLDTLCAQAYGSGRPHLVGLQLQRMLYFLWLITIPIALVWGFGTQILSAVVPEKETAKLAGLYLKVLIAGAPGYAAFESGKRFMQAQGLFSPTMYVLIICAPLNALMNYLFVWVFKWGFIGAPIAVSVTENILPLLLFLYVRFVDGYKCWGGFERRALANWGPMVKLALPGLVMVLAEFLAFEILTLSASWLGTTPLAAQSVLSTIAAITFQIPFPMSVAASTRIANYIGATLSIPAKAAAKVAMIFAVGVGIFNFLLLSLLRTYIPRLFTPDPDVIELVANLLPLCAAFQVFDALACNCNGILRGLGRQEIGGYVGLFAYYVVGLPISFGTGFGLHWGLYGLWSGPAIALGIVATIEGVFIYKTRWEKAVEDAVKRNTMA